MDILKTQEKVTWPDRLADMGEYQEILADYSNKGTIRAAISLFQIRTNKKFSTKKVEKNGQPVLSITRVK